MIILFLGADFATIPSISSSIGIYFCVFIYEVKKDTILLEMSGVDGDSCTNPIESTHLGPFFPEWYVKNALYCLKTMARSQIWVTE